MATFWMILNRSNSIQFQMPDLVPLVDAQEKYKECRQSCAYNFPVSSAPLIYPRPVSKLILMFLAIESQAMVLFTGPQGFSPSLYRTFSDLCSDPSSTVRQTIACGFHEVSFVFGFEIRMRRFPMLIPSCLQIAKLLGPNVETIYAELVVLLTDNSIEVSVFA